MRTTMLNLPNELAEEILSRVPLKSVRLTCRKWNDLCKSQSFRKLHIGKLSAGTKEGETQMVAMIGYNSYLTSIVVDKEDPKIEYKGKLSLLDEQDKITRMFHCEGLLACIVEYDSRFLVWNPYLGQTRWIEPRHPHLPHGRNDMYGPLIYALGKSCSSVKLLWFIDNKYYYKQPEDQLSWFEIYDFDSDSWTNLDDTPTWRKAFKGLGLSLKGNAYWCATERNIDEKVMAVGIICFDFTRERFGPLLPLPFSALASDEYVTLSCVREEKLAVSVSSCKKNPYQLDIWITTKIEAQEVLWSKFLIMPDNNDLSFSYIVGSFFIDEEKKVVMAIIEDYYDNPEFVIIIGEVLYLELDLFGEYVPPKWNPEWKPRMCSYVPSLVQIKRKETAKQEEAKGVKEMIVASQIHKA